MAKRGGFPGGMPGNMNNLMKHQKGNEFYSEKHVLSMWRQFYHRLLEESRRKQAVKARKPLKRVLQLTGGLR